MIAELYLYNNSFKGTIPSTLGNCSYLLYLGLDHNMLHGSIPQELMEDRSLVALNVSYNNLTGDLPSEVGISWRILFSYTFHTTSYQDIYRKPWGAVSPWKRLV